MLRPRFSLITLILLITAFSLLTVSTLKAGAEEAKPVAGQEPQKALEAPVTAQPPQKTGEAAPAPSQGTEQKGKAPKIVLEETLFNFGEMHQETKSTHIFKIKNTGDADLEIKDIKTSCGCTAAMVSKNIILPGETGDLNVIFSSKRFQGEVTRQITLVTNDPANETSVIKIKALVKALLEVNPAYLNFGRITEAKSQTMDVKLKNMTNEVMTLDSITSENKDITIGKYDKDLNPGLGVTIPVTYTSSVKPERPGVAGSIVIQIKGSNEKVLIPFSLQIVGEVQLKPKNLSFNVVKKGETPAKVITIENRGEKEVTILGAKYDSNLIETDAKFPLSIKPGDSSKISITLSSKVAEGKFKGQIEFQTDNPKYPAVSAQILGVLKNKEQQGQQQQPPEK